MTDQIREKMAGKNSGEKAGNKNKQTWGSEKPPAANVLKLDFFVIIAQPEKVNISVWPWQAFEAKFVICKYGLEPINKLL